MWGGGREGEYKTVSSDDGRQIILIGKGGQCLGGIEGKNGDIG